MRRIPDRWLDYRPLGNVIVGTKFIAFKVPLKESYSKRMREDETFTPENLLRSCPSLGMIVDLTNTYAYYDGNIFRSSGLNYVKIKCPGHAIPTSDIVSRFFNVVDAFLKNNDSGSLIGVHCTHGINRTSYFICRYMMSRMGYSPSEAIEAFERARGYRIERKNYINSLYDTFAVNSSADLRGKLEISHKTTGNLDSIPETQPPQLNSANSFFPEMNFEQSNRPSNLTSINEPSSSYPTDYPDTFPFQRNRAQINPFVSRGATYSLRRTYGDFYPKWRTRNFDLGASNLTQSTYNVPVNSSRSELNCLNSAKQDIGMRGRIRMPPPYVVHSARYGSQEEENWDKRNSHLKQIGKPRYP